MEVVKKGEKRQIKVDLTSSELVNDGEFIGLRELYSRLKLKYEKLDIFSNLENEEVFIPLSIFNKKLSSLEVISKYFFENKNLSLKKISELLNRSNRNIWNSYNKSKKKFPSKLIVGESALIPISILRNLNFTLLENIVSYLKVNLEHSYHEIAIFLERDDRTIWTVYRRFEKKEKLQNKTIKEVISGSELVKDEEFIGLRELYNRLKLKYIKLDIFSYLENEEVFIPLSIFNKKLSSLEVISKYLSEYKNLSLKKISKVLNRSNRNIWNAYNKSKKKFSDRLVVKESPLLPSSILRNLQFTLLENIVSYLKENLRFSYHEIAVLLHRDDRTVWTVYNRIKIKREDNG